MGSVCRLFREFETGSRDMTHDELFGILNNLLCADSGITRFREIQAKYPNLYDSDRRCKWERCISYNRSQGYKPSSCNSFCPYCEECSHAKNILTTVHPSRCLMEPDPDYNVNYCSLEEAQDNVYEAIHNAYMQNDNRIYIIKAQVGIGKSHSYLRIMKENPGKRFLIAAPTNLLKNELYDKAKQMGINVQKTPSLDEIKDEIPPKVWKHIQRFRKSGRHYLVHTYINKLLQKRKIPCLKEYMKEHEDLVDFCGSIITTHRYLLNMDKKRLREYDSIIIDEDIIFKSIIPNQEEISISDLKKFAKEVTDHQVRKKLKRLVELTKEQSCIELDSFEFEYDEKNDDDVSIKFDIPSFCMANIFYVRRSAKEPNLKKDTVVFLKPATFKDVKYIMVSAAANEDICRKYFGEDRVDFYECKRATYQGTLNQYPGRSMSRTSIAKDPGIIRRLMKRFNIGADKVITFMREKIGPLHFGNTEGSNTLEGQDILVIGTPYHADFLYKLAALTMGLDFDEDEEVSPQSVKHNGYKFRFTTFKDEKLKSIQFWMLESELEQAVGRARLLRNSCVVHLFSNFPLNQSKMIEDFDYEK